MGDDFYRDRARLAHHRLSETMARSAAGHPLDGNAVLDAQHLVHELTGESGNISPKRCLRVLALAGDVPLDAP